MYVRKCKVCEYAVMRTCEIQSTLVSPSSTKYIPILQLINDLDLGMHIWLEWIKNQ